MTAEGEKFHIKDKNFSELERFFYFTWTNMTHRNSLDSYRVKCMNTLNILREFSEISAKTLPNIYDSIALCIDEAIDIMCKDLVAQKYYHIKCAELKQLMSESKDLIEKQDKQKEKVKQEIDKKNRLIRYIAKSIIHDAYNYKFNCLEYLKISITIPDNYNDVHAITQTLLSVLVDEGFTLESLFQMARSIFFYSDKKYSFLECFDFMSTIVLKKHDIFKIYFALNDIVIEDLAPKDLRDIKILSHKDLPSFDEREDIKDFLSANKGKRYAEITIPSIEAGTACLAAREKLYDMFDIIRFTFKGSLGIYGPKFIFTRESDGASKLLQMPDNIPNPKMRLNSTDAQHFVQDTIALLDRNGIESSTKEKIQSALRFYRVGKDSKFYPNKFLNWWTALEYLVGCHDSSIIASVKKPVTNILGLLHLVKYLQSLCSYIVISKPDNTDNLNRLFGVTSIHGLTPIILYKSLKDATTARDVISEMNHHTICKRRIEYLHNVITNSQESKDFIEHHERKLGWHISRLYRIRCDIVHSASYSLNIVLLSANLEYYLRTVLYYVISKMNSENCLYDLNEIYEVAEYSYLKFQESIKNNDFDYIESIINSCNFNLSI